MRSLKALASNKIANSLRGNIDQRMATAMTLDIPELARRNIIHELERDRELISEFYNAVNVKEKIQHLNFYILQNNFEKVRTVFKYYPEKLNLPDTNNTTPLMMAAEHDLTGSIVEQLLTIGIDDSSQRLTNSIGETAFLIATLVVNVKALRVFRTHPKSVWHKP
jgi:ankyrin repeat protein